MLSLFVQSTRGGMRGAVFNTWPASARAFASASANASVGSAGAESLQSPVASSGSGKLSSSAKKPRVIVLAGPTGVGKTSLSLSLARELGGEIVSADSVQIYRGMDIGSAKVLEGTERKPSFFNNRHSLDQSLYLQHCDPTLPFFFSADRCPRRSARRCATT